MGVHWCHATNSSSGPTLHQPAPWATCCCADQTGRCLWQLPQCNILNVQMSVRRSCWNMNQPWGTLKRQRVQLVNFNCISSSCGRRRGAVCSCCCCAGIGAW